MQLYKASKQAGHRYPEKTDKIQSTSRSIHLFPYLSAGLNPPSSILRICIKFHICRRNKLIECIEWKIKI